jgi:hypothetical protein
MLDHGRPRHPDGSAPDHPGEPTSKSRFREPGAAAAVGSVPSHPSEADRLVVRSAVLGRPPAGLAGLEVGLGARSTRNGHRLASSRLRVVLDPTVASEGRPSARSTARGWLGGAPTAVVCLDVADLSEPELRQEVLKLRRRVQKLTALLRLVLAVFRTSGFRLTEERLPEGRDKIRILRAVDRARAFVPLRALLRFLHVSPSRLHAWRRRQRAVRSTISRPVPAHRRLD